MGYYGGKLFALASIVNPFEPIPLGAIQFENSTDYIFFEGQSEPNYITFETI